METVDMQAQPDHLKIMAHNRYHRQGPIIRYNSIDNGLLASPYPYMYTNLVRSSHYQPSHRLVQVQHQLSQPQPPLLPLPTTIPQHSSLPLRTSSGKLNRKNKNKDAACILKTNPKKEVTSLKELGSKKTKHSGQSNDEYGREDHLELSDLVFTMSPHPSSLPLPKFFMRQRSAATATKLSCKVEAKTGTSVDDLRRILRLP